MSASDHPFHRLTPAFVMDAIESRGYRCDCRTLALNSVRMVLQLLLVGVILKAVFDAATLPWIVLIAMVMMGLAGYEVVARQKRARPGVGSVGDPFAPAGFVGVHPDRDDLFDGDAVKIDRGNHRAHFVVIEGEIGDGGGGAGPVVL